MEFSDKIRTLGDKVTRLKETVETEEAPKTAFVMPFIAALDYDVFDPLEVIPEFVADLGIKKGEKIDYCILKNSKPIIIIECKHWRENLSNHKNQLHRYFYATSAKFAVLTNGIQYRFYTDSEHTNKMDNNPFWEFKINNLSDTDIRELGNYRKSNFDIGQIFSTALDLKISNRVRQVIKKELNDPSDGFVKFFARQIHSGTLTKKIIDQYKGIIKKSLNQLLSEPTQEKTVVEVHRPFKDTKEFNGKNPVMVEAGRKAAETRKNATYTIDEHINKVNGDLKDLLNEMREYIVNLDTSIEEAPKKYYIAYKTTQNFVCIEPQKKKIVLFLKLNPDEIEKLPRQARDVRNIGHFATGDLELTIKNTTDFEETKALINKSLINIGR